MSNVKKLISHTAIYGLSSIIGRTLNWFLVPLYTRVLAESDYGVSNTIYAYAGFMLIFMSIGMETAFFRFSKSKDYSNNIFALLYSNVLIISLILLLFSKQISFALGVQHFVFPFALTIITLSLDALCILPFAKLRNEEKAFHFVTIKLLNIAINIGLNLYFYWFKKQTDVTYMFWANAIASAATYLLLLPQTFHFRFKFDVNKQVEILKYALPLVGVGLAGIVNEMIDRPMLLRLLPHSNAENLVMIGIYSASYKLSMIMTMFRQAYVLSAEPLFFKKSLEKDAREYYAKTLEYFMAASCIIFLSTTLFLPFIQYFVGEKYRSGMFIVPILLLANLFLGVYYNLSVWYKMSDKTNWGAIISIIGASITVLLNLILIPKFGYAGSAYATLICYILMVIISFALGQKKYFIPYNTLKLFSMLFFTLTLFLFSKYFFSIANVTVAIQVVFNVFLLIVQTIALVFIHKKFPNRAKSNSIK